MSHLSAAQASDPAAVVGIVLLIIIAIVLYWLPTIIGARRHVPNIGSVAVINAFLGWTVVGWVVALAMAARSVSRVPERSAPPVDMRGYH